MFTVYNISVAITTMFAYSRDLKKLQNESLTPSQLTVNGMWLNDD